MAALTRPTPDSDRFHALVLCPMHIEWTHVSRAVRCAGLTGVRVLQTGIGKDAILRALDRELHEVSKAPQPSVVILAGVAGGLSAVDDVPPISRIIDANGREWTPTHAPAHLVRGVTLIAVDEIISSPADKRALAERTGASIVDMESHAFAQRCEALGLAWSVVRGVSDTPEETLPSEVLSWVTPEGDTRTLRAIVDLARKPTLIPHMVATLRRSSRVMPKVGARVDELLRAAALRESGSPGAGSPYAPA